MASPGCSALLLLLPALLLAALAVSGVTDSVGPALLVVSVVLALCWRSLRRRDAGTERRVCVLVLGDIGRSPRMQYHALSLSRHGYLVTFVGFSDTTPHRDVLSQENIRVRPISEVKGVGGGPKLLTYVTKAALQSLQLLYVLLTMELQAHILMQNPPGLPGMAVAWLVSAVRGSSFTVDWHNYGFTIMALSLGTKHPVVRLAQWYERVFGSLSSNNLCVTEAMRDDLQTNWSIRAVTLYDRPASIFREIPLDLQHQLFARLARTLPQFQNSGSEETDAETTIFTIRDPRDGSVSLRSDRPALLVSSTSWTEDEDFSVLLKALEEYDGLVGGGGGGASLPPLLCVITGKGPQKGHYRTLMDALQLQHVRICTPWLHAEDYPLLLGAADLGVCLHVSSSGLDLPMKVVDMFGCCLPVCAVSFHCLSELVKHGENGLIFRDAAELAQQLQTLLVDFPSPDGQLGAFRRNLRTSRGQSWEDNWDQKVLPLMCAQR